jgi:hypothetical protein
MDERHSPSRKGGDSNSIVNFKARPNTSGALPQPGGLRGPLARRSYVRWMKEQASRTHTRTPGTSPAAGQKARPYVGPCRTQTLPKCNDVYNQQESDEALMQVAPGHLVGRYIRTA